MTRQASPFGLLRGIVLIGLAALALGVYASRAGTELTKSLRLPIDVSTETVLPARIEPGSASDVISDFPAQVVAVYAQVGSVVEPGETLLVLENREISAQVEAAEKRLAAAAAHLDTVKSRASSVLRQDLAEERMRSARRNRDLAKQRLQAFSLAGPEAAFNVAAERLETMRPLVPRGLATEAELDEYARRRSTASRELEAAREHYSRLRQELEQAESQIRLLELDLSAASVAPASMDADYADAKAALLAAQERNSRLVVKAPGRGTVLSLGVREGDWIQAGARVARIADLSKLTISAPVTATLAGAIRVGHPVSVLLPGLDSERIPTAVHDVTLVPDELYQAYLVKAIIPNPDPATVLVGLEAQLEFDHLDAR